MLQRARHAGVILAALVASHSVARAQTSRIPALTATADLRLDAKQHRLTGTTTLAIGPAGEIIVGQTRGSEGVRGFDSTGKPLPWSVAAGGRNAEISCVNSIGWLGSDFVVTDPCFDQFAVVTLAGKVTKSIGVPKLVRPALADRRKFPTISDATPLAVYPDRSVLALLYPEGPSLDAPEFDRSVRHIVRVRENGGIIRQVATIPLTDMFRTAPTSTALERLFPNRLWHVSPSGKRIAVVSTKPAGRDSASVRVTVVGEVGDTVYSIEYRMPLAAVPKTTRDSAATNRPVVGRGRRGTSPGDTAALPRFYPAVSNVRVGRDFTVWLETVDAKGRRYLVLDPRGVVIGTFTGSPTFRLLEADRSRVWGVEGERAITAIVRYHLGPSKP